MSMFYHSNDEVYSMAVTALQSLIDLHNVGVKLIRSDLPHIAGVVGVTYTANGTLNFIHINRNYNTVWVQWPTGLADTLDLACVDNYPATKKGFLQVMELVKQQVMVEILKGCKYHRYNKTATSK